MIVKVINIENEKVVLEYDIYEDIQSRYSETEAEFNKLDHPYLPLSTPEFTSLMAMRDKSMLTTKSGKFMIIGELDIDAEEGIATFYCEEYKSSKPKKEEVAKKSSFGRK